MRRISGRGSGPPPGLPLSRVGWRGPAEPALGVHACGDGERGEHQRGARRSCGARDRVCRSAVSERVRARTCRSAARWSGSCVGISGIRSRRRRCWRRSGTASAGRSSAFAAEHEIPILALKKPDRSRWDDRKLDHVRPYLERPSASGRFGVVAIVACQEFQWVFSARNRAPRREVVSFDFFQRGAPGRHLLLLHPRPRVRARVHQDLHLLPVSGQGLAQRARVGQTPSRPRRGSASPRCPTGSPSCAEPERLQAICDSFGPEHVQAFFDRWITRIPTPFTARGPRRRLLVGALDAPGRGVPHAGVRRPPPGPRVLRGARRRQHRHRPPRARSRWCSPARSARPTQRPASRPGSSPPAPRSRSTSATSTRRVKQYLKDGRALRIETVINKPTDLDVLARLAAPARADRQGPPGQRPSAYDRACRSGLCHRLCALRAHPPALPREGQRTGALRFGDQRAMALAGALCHVVHAVTGFTNKSLRGLVAGLLGQDYSHQQDELRPAPPPPPRPHRTPARTATPTSSPPTGIRVAVFYTKLHNRLLRPLLDADKPPANTDIRRALATLEHAVNDYTTTPASPRSMKLVTTSHIPATKKN